MLTLLKLASFPDERAGNAMDLELGMDGEGGPPGSSVERFGLFRESRRWEIVPLDVLSLMSCPSLLKLDCRECDAVRVGVSVGKGGSDLSIDPAREWVRDTPSPAVDALSWLSIISSTSPPSSAPSAAVNPTSSSMPTEGICRR